MADTSLENSLARGASSERALFLLLNLTLNGSLLVSLFWFFSFQNLQMLRISSRVYRRVRIRRNRQVYFPLVPLFQYSIEKLCNIVTFAHKPSIYKGFSRYTFCNIGVTV